MATNMERAAATRTRLVDAARQLFAARGYAATGTEAVLEAVQLGRGALYHHFADKAELFEAVCFLLATEAGAAIDQATARVDDPLDALVRGSIAWVDYATSPGVRRILLLDAPTVLGLQRWEELDRALGFASLEAGIRHAQAVGALRPTPDAGMLAVLVNGALNSLALRLASSGEQWPRSQWVPAVEQFWAAFKDESRRPKRTKHATSKES
jgi:AcrR family transcriptional regulator